MINFYEGKNAVLMYALSVIIGVTLAIDFLDRGRNIDASFVAVVLVFALWRIVMIGRGKKWEQ
jgi:hypothetical protein